MLQVRSEAMFLRELSEGKRIVDIRDYYEKHDHSLMVIEYLDVRDKRDTTSLSSIKSSSVGH